VGEGLDHFNAGCALLPPCVAMAIMRSRPLCEMSKTGVIVEFWHFLRIRKKFWLAPIIAVLLLLSLLIVLTQGSALAPFIYALF
jgi:hypothetical protein